MTRATPSSHAPHRRHAPRPTAMTTALPHDQPGASAFYDPATYLRHDLGLGTATHRSGTKVVTLTSDFLRGLHRALTEETGEAWTLVLYRCGLIWGERVAERMEREFEAFYDRPLRELRMTLFVELLEEYFATNGWGRLTIDFRLANHGLVEFELADPLYASVIGRSDGACEFLVAGLLGSIFSRFAGAALLCHQTECVSLGDPVSRFLLGDARRLDPVPGWVAERTRHDEMVRRLVRS